MTTLILLILSNFAFFIVGFLIAQHHYKSLLKTEQKRSDLINEQVEILKAAHAVYKEEAKSIQAEFNRLKKAQ